MKNDLSKLLKPQSVAVVGASPNEGSVAGTILQNLHSCGFSGDIFPVNPKYETVFGFACYPSISALPDTTDLAILAINRSLVLQAVEECGERGIRHLVIVTAGFKEAGAEGERLESALRDLIARYDLNVVGPNCMGIIHRSEGIKLNASFSRWFLTGGGIGFISQSGSLGETLLETFEDAGLGVSTFINLGNRAGLTENDFLRLLADDPQCRAIFLYLESFAEPHEFRRILESIHQDKPVVVLKAGRTKAGAAAVVSHTGSLASPDAIVDAFLRQCGALRVTTIDEALSALRVLQKGVLPAGNRVVILTNAGGAGIIAADACERLSIDVPALSDEVQMKLREFLPPEAGYGNPVDMIATASSEHYEKALETTLPSVDAAIVIFRPPMVYHEPVENVADGILRVLAKMPTKPVLVCTLSRSDMVTPLVKRLQEQWIPSYVMPETAVSAVDVLCRVKALEVEAQSANEAYSTANGRAIAGQILEQAAAEGRTGLSFGEGAEILAAYGLSVCPFAYIESLEDGIVFLKQACGPIVLKIDSPQLLHRFEANAVITDIETNGGLVEAFLQLRETIDHLGMADARILAQKMLAGRELIIGLDRDPSFGPAIMFGIGGTLVEALRDVSFGVSPISQSEAETMIRSIRAFPLLQAFRGQPAVDLESLADIITRLGQLATDCPNIAELDLNPVIATTQGTYAVDILFRVASS
ncbi:acetate--CoA ligase family protein [Candidatus Bipolaricaulota bacterium]|nr:acetate--CoA ligase family protein [Candidatus Bipolaricaulota bacterium]